MVIIMTKIMYAGFGQPHVINKLLKMLANGLQIDGIVVEARLLYSAGVKNLSKYAKAKEQMQVWLDLRPPTKNPPKDEKWMRYIDTLIEDADDYFNAIIPWISSSNPEFYREIIDSSPVPVATWYNGKGSYDTDILLVHDDEFTDVHNVVKEAKNRGVSNVVWYSYGKFKSFDRDYNNPNIDTLIITNWNGVLMSGVTYFEKYSKLVYTNVTEISQPEWERFVKKYEEQIKQYGLKMDNILNQKKSTWDKAFFNMIILEQKRYEAIPRKTMPVTDSAFGCHNCIMADRCPMYTPGSTTCPLLEKRMADVKFDDIDGLLDGLLLNLIKEKYVRYMRGRIFEELEGGALDKHVSRMEDSITKLIESYLKLKYPERFKASLENNDDDESSEIDLLLERLGDRDGSQ